MTKWTTGDIPDQHGRTVVVTGANSGLGEAVARELSAAGARVLMACRDIEKAELAADRMPGEVDVRQLDLADLGSVRAFAAGIDGEIAVLVNNAGVMAVPEGRTADGFERQIGVNHLGHFALTGLLLDRITDRVVTVSSAMHWTGRVRADDLNFEHRRYERWTAYGQSKLANLLFAYELQRRFEAAGSARRSVAAHPGYAATGLQSHTESVQDRIMGLGNVLFAQSPEMGALPTLYAATSDALRGGGFAGPRQWFGVRGHPGPVRSSRASHDRETARALWERSEELTGVTFTLPV
jgi:NAD(P)-dependent dehydrogenase (short-subunit alcohol dehydrogenase family)